MRRYRTIAFNNLALKNLVQTFLHEMGVVGKQFRTFEVQIIPTAHASMASK